MEEYLQNMKNLRSQMNDIEEEAANRSVEEQKQKTVIDTIEKDLQLVRSESKRLNNEAEEMVRAKAQICCQIVEKQRKISSVEAESSTLSQTLELLQQEMLSVSAKLKEKRTYYTRIMDELSVKLHDQQEWFDSYKQKMLADTPSVVEHPIKQLGSNNGNPNEELLMEAKVENMGDETNGRDSSNLMTQLETAETKLEEVKAKKSEIALENSKSKRHMEQLKQRIDDVPPALKAMDVKDLEVEHKALLADKAGEIEYLQSLHDQIKQLKGISHVVKCRCGEEYKVELMV